MALPGSRTVNSEALFTQPPAVLTLYGSFKKKKKKKENMDYLYAINIFPAQPYEYASRSLGTFKVKTCSTVPAKINLDGKVNTGTYNSGFEVEHEGIFVHAG